MTPEQQKALREPFPDAVVGQLPKGGQMLSYVGHAAVVDRLLAVDPEWTWEPVALGPDGLPAYDERGNLWIRLTVAGVTRLGVGDGPDPKQRISDALRNAAMRFGVALDLWAKEDLQAMHREPVVTKDPEWVEQTIANLETAETEAQVVDLGTRIKHAADAGDLSDHDRDRLAAAYRPAITRVKGTR